MSDLVYRCSKNPRHVITDPKPRSLCPAIVRGSPCRGELEQIGGGVTEPKSKRKETSAA